MVLRKDFFEKVDFEKINRWQKSIQNYPVGKELIHIPVQGYFWDGPEPFYEKHYEWE